MKYAKLLIALALVLALVLLPDLLQKEAPGGEYSPGSEDLSGVDRIVLTNCHNGRKTDLTDPEAIASVIAFLRKTVGSHPESGRGYYEGSFSLELFRGDTEVLSLAYGDSDCFYTGKGADGYPLRYPLTGMTVKEDVVPFFSGLEEGRSA